MSRLPVKRLIDGWHVAAINGTIAAFADRQTYARDMHFAYVFQAGESPRKASKLIDDRRFLHPDDGEARETKQVP
jgi:hypothetical protein